LKPDQVVGISLFDYFQTSDPSFAGISASYRALNGESVTFEMPWSGTPFQAHIEPFRDAEGHIIGTIGMAFDVSEQKNYQRRLEEHASAQTHLLRQLLTAQESERRRLSMEIHDGPLQSLGVAILAIDRTLRRQVLGEHQEAADELAYVRDTVDDIVSDIRAILADLSLDVLMGYGLVPALRDHTERFTQLTGIRVDLRNNLQHRVPSHIELLMYRLVQESLANVRKHSGASQVEISLHLDDGHLVMSVADNGSGFDPEKVTTWHAAGEHIGLASMRQRITDAQGDLRVQSAPGKGTNLTFTVPVSFRTTELNTGDLTPHARHLSGRE
jgi:signal transduction histidine kinase